MPDPTPKLEMILADPRELRWRPPAQALQPPPAEPEEMDLAEIEARVGFHILVPSAPEAHRVRSAWIPGSIQYFGTLSEGVHSVYTYDSSDQALTLQQVRIIHSSYPMMFLYLDNVRAYQTSIREGTATVVIPSWADAHPFVELVLDDMLITVVFFWAVSEQTMISIVESLL